MGRRSNLLLRAHRTSFQFGTTTVDSTGPVILPLMHIIRKITGIWVVFCTESVKYLPMFTCNNLKVTKTKNLISCYKKQLSK